MPQTSSKVSPRQRKQRKKKIKIHHCVTSSIMWGFVFLGCTAESCTSHGNTGEVPAALAGPMPPPRQEEIPTWGTWHFCTCRAVLQGTLAVTVPVLLPHLSLTTLPALTQPTWEDSWAQPRTPLKPTLLIQPAKATAPWPSIHRDTPAPALTGESRCTKTGPTCNRGPSQAHTLFRWQAKPHRGHSPTSLSMEGW